jgi:hypothetical protein
LIIYRIKTLTSAKVGGRLRLAGNARMQGAGKIEDLNRGDTSVIGFYILGLFTEMIGIERG